MHGVWQLNSHSLRQREPPSAAGCLLGSTPTFKQQMEMKDSMSLRTRQCDSESDSSARAAHGARARLSCSLELARWILMETGDSGATHVQPSSRYKVVDGPVGASSQP